MNKERDMAGRIVSLIEDRLIDNYPDRQAEIEDLFNGVSYYDCEDGVFDILVEEIDSIKEEILAEHDERFDEALNERVQGERDEIYGKYHLIPRKVEFMGGILNENNVNDIIKLTDILHELLKKDGSLDMNTILECGTYFINHLFALDSKRED